MNKIKVTVIYALPNIQFLRKIIIKSGSTVEDALLASNIISEDKKINIYKNKIGIYGIITHLKHIVKEGDQIEIYRNLTIDPKELRRKKLNFNKN
ncbi:RnfH family protein [Buchnera aphidicola (Pemphigus obesinymphae)]|uniref:RnfH family protein n=1 Tax=Buchnera aphidicola TaxID=9 RepID=UPI0022386ACD|nr:RnfH family protein [Buchnera aphidicola]MCW5196489.1 RnfH family protein [Buchnera aphidicola (Pemphigus obesinymphae)]